MYRELPIHTTGLKGCFNTLQPLQDCYRVELLHREIPVVITGNGFAVWVFIYNFGNCMKMRILLQKIFQPIVQIERKKEDWRWQVHVSPISLPNVKLRVYIKPTSQNLVDVKHTNEQNTHTFKTQYCGLWEIKWTFCLSSDRIHLKTIFEWSLLSAKV